MGSSIGLGSFLTLLAGTVVTSELFILLPFKKNGGKLANLLRRVTRILRSSRISDHWKERVMLTYAGILLRSSLLLSMLVLAASIPVAISFEMVVDSFEQALRLSTSPSVLLGMILASVLYLFIRKRLYVRLHKS